ncbi:MAG: transporter substrate-binding domain-containing protein [Deltaproteobacteria bacterium]|nr:transporter substrate-binding domain-containing protein [Deltaproteobacteria bacterium]
MSDKSPFLTRRAFMKGVLAGSAVVGSGLLAGCASDTDSAGTTDEEPQVEGDVLQKIVDEGKMTVAVIIYPPDTSKEGGELKGTFIEAAKWIASEMDVDLEYVESEWGTFVAAIQSGRADVAVASSFATVSRSMAVNFTKPIYYLGYSALSRQEDVDKWKTIEDAAAAGAVFAEREGTPVHKSLTDMGAEMISLPAGADPTQMTLEVLTGRANIYVEDDWLVKNLVAEHSDELAEMPTYAEKPWQLNAVAWAVAKGQANLLNVINVAIDRLVANNMLQDWQVEFEGHGLYKKDAFYNPS